VGPYVESTGNAGLSSAWLVEDMGADLGPHRCRFSCSPRQQWVSPHWRNLLKALNLSDYRPGLWPPPFKGQTATGLAVSLVDLQGQVRARQLLGLLVCGVPSRDVAVSNVCTGILRPRASRCWGSTFVRRHTVFSNMPRNSA